MKSRIPSNVCSTGNPPPTPDDEVSRRVLEAIGTLRFGSVEVTVHDGRVVQIDRKERVRFGNCARQ
jgi:hypothetical protein